MPPRAPWKRSGAMDSAADASGKPRLGQRLSFPLKANLAAFVSEFVGTFLFLFVSWEPDSYTPTLSGHMLD